MTETAEMSIQKARREYERRQKDEGWTIFRIQLDREVQAQMRMKEWVLITTGNLDAPLP